MAFEDDRERRRRSENAPESATHDIPRSKKRRGSSPELGQALRAAYEQAVKEDIPPEMLDLLGKLG
ncbi:MAG TPA: NepR family anti-sigma factor [Allosphingosinicella sp.]